MLFDRRMLEIAGIQLALCKDLASTLVELSHNRRSINLLNKVALECDLRAGIKGGSRINFTPPYDELAHSRAMYRLEAVNDDISHVNELKSVFCTLTTEVKVLPCLWSRFSDDVVACELWWADIRTSAEFNL